MATATSTALATSKNGNHSEITVAPDESLTVSQSFEAKVKRQFSAELGGALHWSPIHSTLAQHLYVKLDRILGELEIKRSGATYKKNDPTITWPNINMTRLALDSVMRIALELDAALPNHIFPIPYLNKRTGKYDIDLRIGYEGNDFIHRKFALNPILDIEYVLVHEGDEFSIGRDHGAEVPVHVPKDYFLPGPVVGGFGYVRYADHRLNRVIVVPFREFEKAKKAAGNAAFWGGEQTEWVNNQKVNTGHDDKFMVEMQYKTVVHRVCKKILLDTSKIHALMATAVAEASLDFIEADVADDVEQNGNKELLTIPSPTEADAGRSVVEETGEIKPGNDLQEQAGF